eukprot:scaffold15590_cov136-Isochrysis_galbana.AAC.11
MQEGVAWRGVALGVVVAVALGVAGRRTWRRLWSGARTCEVARGSTRVVRLCQLLIEKGARNTPANADCRRPPAGLRW